MPVSTPPTPWALPSASHLQVMPGSAPMPFRCGGTSQFPVTGTACAVLPPPPREPVGTWPRERRSVSTGRLVAPCAGQWVPTSTAACSSAAACMGQQGAIPSAPSTVAMLPGGGSQGQVSSAASLALEDGIATRISSVLQECKSRMVEHRKEASGLRSQRDFLVRSLQEAELDFVRLGEECRRVEKQLLETRHQCIQESEDTRPRRAKSARGNVASSRSLGAQNLRQLNGDVRGASRPRSGRSSCQHSRGSGHSSRSQARSNTGKAAGPQLPTPRLCSQLTRRECSSADACVAEATRHESQAGAERTGTERCLATFGDGHNEGMHETPWDRYGNKAGPAALAGETQVPGSLACPNLLALAKAEGVAEGPSSICDSQHLLSRCSSSSMQPASCRQADDDDDSSSTDTMITCIDSVMGSAVHACSSAVTAGGDTAAGEGQQTAWNAANNSVANFAGWLKRTSVDAKGTSHEGACPSASVSSSAHDALVMQHRPTKKVESCYRWLDGQVERDCQALEVLMVSSDASWEGSIKAAGRASTVTTTAATSVNEQLSARAHPPSDYSMEVPRRTIVAWQLESWWGAFGGGPDAKVLGGVFVDGGFKPGPRGGLRLPVPAGFGAVTLEAWEWRPNQELGGYSVLTTGTHDNGLKFAYACAGGITVSRMAGCREDKALAQGRAQLVHGGWNHHVFVLTPQLTVWYVNGLRVARVDEVSSHSSSANSVLLANCPDLRSGDASELVQFKRATLYEGELGADEVRNLFLKGHDDRSWSASRAGNPEGPRSHQPSASLSTAVGSSCSGSRSHSLSIDVKKASATAVPVMVESTPVPASPMPPVAPKFGQSWGACGTNGVTVPTPGSMPTISLHNLRTDSAVGSRGSCMVPTSPATPNGSLMGWTPACQPGGSVGVPSTSTTRFASPSSSMRPSCCHAVVSSPRASRTSVSPCRRSLSVNVPAAGHVQRTPSMCSTAPPTAAVRSGSPTALGALTPNGQAAPQCMSPPPRATSPGPYPSAVFTRCATAQQRRKSEPRTTVTTPPVQQAKATASASNAPATPGNHQKSAPVPVSVECMVPVAVETTGHAPRPKDSQEPAASSMPLPSKDSGKCFSATNSVRAGSGPALAALPPPPELSAPGADKQGLDVDTAVAAHVARSPMPLQLVRLGRGDYVYGGERVELALIDMPGGVRKLRARHPGYNGGKYMSLKKFAALHEELRGKPWPTNVQSCQDPGST